MTVEFDTTKLDRAMRELSAGIDSGAKGGARAQAERTAAAIRERVPHRTGRLAASVAVVGDTEGAAVSYGSGVPYASYIEHRSHAVADGIEGADREFADAMHDLAASVVQRL